MPNGSSSLSLSIFEGTIAQHLAVMQRGLLPSLQLLAHGHSPGGHVT